MMTFSSSWLQQEKDIFTRVKEDDIQGSTRGCLSNADHLNDTYCGLCMSSGVLLD